MKIAYLCNIYPRITHTFIRREIYAIEKEGIAIERITIRRSPDSIQTPEDVAEQERTFGVLEGGAFGVLFCMISVFIRHPVGLLRGAWKALVFGMRSNAGILKHLAYFGEACVVHVHCRRKEITHIHVHFATNAAMVGLLVRILGGPTISFTIHGAAEWDCPEFIHMPEKIEYAEFVVAISYFTKAQAYRWTSPAHFSKIHVIRCGVDERFLSCTVSDVPEVDQLLVIGRLVSTKGHVILLEALQNLVAEGAEFRVKLIGDGPLRRFIESQIVDRGLEDYVEICGWMDNNDVHLELVNSRAMILPSFGEGLPVVIMEALALARPVICTRIAAISELVVNEENGWLVNAGNARELADAIRAVLNATSTELSKMGAAGRRAVLAKHDAVTEARKLAGLFEDYLSREQGSA